MKLRKYISRFVLSLCALFFSFIASAQPVEMADTMRGNGKIYVVVAVCLVILIGLFLYVVNIDRKVKKLERDSKSQ